MRTFIIHSLAIVLVGFATGCATSTPAERSAKMQKEIDEMIQVYGPACEKLGFKADTDPWRECILRLDTNKALENYSIRSTPMVQCWGHRNFFQCAPF